MLYYVTLSLPSLYTRKETISFHRGKVEQVLTPTMRLSLFFGLNKKNICEIGNVAKIVLGKKVQLKNSSLSAYNFLYIYTHTH